MGLLFCIWRTIRNQKLVYICTFVILIFSMYGYVMLTSLPEENLTLTSKVFWQRYVNIIPALLFFFIVKRFLYLERLELMQQCYETDLIR